MERTTINERIKLLIAELGLNNNSFAGKIGLTQTAIVKTVNGESKPRFEMIEKILEVFPTVSVKWLVSGAGPMFITDEPNSLSVSPVMDDYLQKYLANLEESFKKVIDEKNKTIEDKNSTIQTLLYSIDVLRHSNPVPGKQLVNEKKSAVMEIVHNVYENSVNSFVNTGS